MVLLSFCNNFVVHKQLLLLFGGGGKERVIQEEEGIDCQTCCPVGTSGVGDGKIPPFFLRKC